MASPSVQGGMVEAGRGEFARRSVGVGRWRRWAEMWSIDVRTAALLRVVTAGLVLADLGSRAGQLAAHYSDAGLLPGVVLRGQSGWVSGWSVHLLTGEAWFAGVLFAVAGVLAWMLLVGYRTRVVTIASWLMLLSLHHRNPLVLDEGDALLRMMLFWGMFLPWGACYSVDSALKEESSEAKGATWMTRVAGIALMVQVAWAGWPWAWRAATAVTEKGLRAGVLEGWGIEGWLTAVGREVWGWGGVVEGLGVAAPLLLLAGPMVVFLPWKNGPARVGVVVGMVGLGVSGAVCLRMGLSPLMWAAGWLCFLPGWFWERLWARLRTPGRLGLTLWYDRYSPGSMRKLRLLRTFLLLGETRLRATQEEVQIDVMRRARQSWVVTDQYGYRYVRFRAFAEVCRHSPLLGVVSPVLRSSLVEVVGDWVYDVYKRVRPVVRWLVRERTARRQTPWSGRVGAGLAAGACVYLLAVGAGSFGMEGRWGAVRAAGDAVGLEPVAMRWEAGARDGWLVAPAELGDGTRVDLLTSKPVTWERPGAAVTAAGGVRGERVLWRLVEEAYRPYRQAYMAYLCGRYNAGRDAGKRVARFDLVQLRSQARGEPAGGREVKTVLASHACEVQGYGAEWGGASD